MKGSYYADLSVIGMKGCEQFVAQVDYYLKEWRRHDTDGTFLVDSACSRFGSGEAKGNIINRSEATMFTLYVMCSTMVSHTICMARSFL